MLVDEATVEEGREVDGKGNGSWADEGTTARFVVVKVLKVEMISVDGGRDVLLVVVVR